MSWIFYFLALSLSYRADSAYGLGGTEVEFSCKAQRKALEAGSIVYLPNTRKCSSQEVSGHLPRRQTCCLRQAILTAAEEEEK